MKREKVRSCSIVRVNKPGALGKNDTDILCMRAKNASQFKLEKICYAIF